MEDVIRLLPDSIANQIAAGEVVQRPASVVKELMENSVDAGSTHIKLIIKDAGKALIHIIDDGIGMSGTDARMSFERHATSKLRKAEDLFSIRSMGFRGEALASIAAVSQVEMKTRKESDELGNVLHVEASEVKLQELGSTGKGTSIAVKNIFYNIPARRNFLKSNPVELKHIHDEFQRIALSNSTIKFTYLQNDEEIYKLEAGKLSKRIVQLFGKNYQQQLIPCHEETPDVKVTGYIGKPEFAKKTRGEQYFFINNRFIKNPYLNHAISKAYESMLHDDYFPFYVLFIEMEPSHVDINVHPTKTEVKFDDDRLLYGIIMSSVRQALASYNVSPSLDFGTDVNFEHFTSRINAGHSISPKDKDYVEFKSFKKDTSGNKDWEQLYRSADDEDIFSKREAIKETSSHEFITFKSEINEFSDRPRDKTTLQIHGQYLVRQVKSGMVVVNQRAANERILYEKYLKRFKNHQGLSQSCLFPTQIELNPSDMSLVLEIKSEIQKLGFEFEALGKNTIVINGVPPEIIDSSEKDVFEELLEQFKHNQSELNIDLNENLARSLSKRMSVKINRNLDAREVDELFDQLFGSDQPNYTPDGNPTFVVLSLDKIASLLN